MCFGVEEKKNNLIYISATVQKPFGPMVKEKSWIEMKKMSAVVLMQDSGARFVSKKMI